MFTYWIREIILTIKWCNKVTSEKHERVPKHFRKIVNKHDVVIRGYPPSVLWYHNLSARVDKSIKIRGLPRIFILLSTSADKLWYHKTRGGYSFYHPLSFFSFATIIVNISSQNPVKILIRKKMTSSGVWRYKARDITLLRLDQSDAFKL